MNTRIRITWEMRNGDREYVGSINEMFVNTVAQATTWVTKQLPGRNSGEAEVDQVVIEEFGDFTDDEGCPKDARIIAKYDPYFDQWEFIKH